MSNLPSKYLTKIMEHGKRNMKKKKSANIWTNEQTMDCDMGTSLYLCYKLLLTWTEILSGCEIQNVLPNLAAVCL